MLRLRSSGGNSLLIKDKFTICYARRTDTYVS